MSNAVGKSHLSTILDKTNPLGHFRVTLCLCFKTSPRAKPFIRKICMSGTHFHMNVLHEDSF